MSKNHQLKSCLFDFLSNTTFSGYEFKDLRALFINYYPQFSSRKYYSKIYQAIRELAAVGLILIDMRSCTYKYSSNYSRSDFLYFMENNESNEIKNKLLLEYDRVITTLDHLHNELNIYQIYLDKFPVLSEIIKKFISKKRNEINLLECEKKAINNLIEAC